MDASSVITYLSARQCAAQWKIFLLSTARELSDKFSATELRAFMRRVGIRFGKELPLPACATLDDLHIAIGETWTRLDWGWAEITDLDDHLHIQHYCSPLQSALGNEALAWAPAFLEGVYQEWFAQLGADGVLQVTQVSGFDSVNGVGFRLGAAPGAA